MARKRLTVMERRYNTSGLKRDDAGVWRDQWDRPCLIPRDGGPRAPYIRASRTGELVDDPDLIINWKLRTVGAAVTFNPHLQTAIRANHRKRNRMNEIMKEALVLGKGTERAHLGTAEHHFFDDADLDRRSDAPKEVWDDIEAYLDLTVPRLEHLAIEQFVAIDTWINKVPVFIAGSLDRRSRLKRAIPFPKELQDEAGMDEMPAGEVVIVDNKTGQSVDYGQLSWGLQVACYAHGDPYDLLTDKRVILPEDAKPRTDWALIMHAPYGQGEASLHWINIGKAWTYLVIAIARLDAQATKDSLMAPVKGAHVIRRDLRGSW